MKKFLLNLVLLAVLCFPVAICAQSIVEIGSSAGTSYRLPLNMEYKYSLTQQIYKADEIEVAGTVSSVSFYYRNTAPMLIQRLRLYMMHTAKTSFESNDDIVSLDTATLVYEGDFAADSTGWFTLNLNNAFEYNGTDNLLICFCDTVIDDSFGTNYKFRCSGSIVNYTSISYYSNTDIPDVNDLSVYGGSKERYTYRNNIRLGITPAAGHCFKPTSLAVTDETAYGALVSWTAREGETTWQICLNGDEDNLINVNTNPYELTGLTPETTYTLKMRTTCYEGAFSGWTSNVSFTTFTACPVPTGLTTLDRSTTTVTMTWEAGGSETEWQVCINNNEDSLIDVTENEYTLTGLIPNTQTRVNVRANCGEEGYSNWVSGYATTISACQAPTALTCTPDVHSANISWTAGADETLWNIRYKVTSESHYTNVNGLTSPTYTITGLASGTAYTVMVQGDCEANGTSGWRTSNFTTKYGIPFLEEFDATPENWSRGQGLLSTVLDGGSLNINSSSGWAFCSYNYNLNGVFDSHAYVNLWGSSRKEWLITPNIVMDANVQLTFDLALTQYSGTLQPVDTTRQQDDKFIVLISTDDGATWTILRQYDNEGSEYVYNNIATSGEEVLIGLADYGTDNVKIAFYGESTVTGGDVNIHIDNVKLDYIRPLDLTVSNITATTADVAWNSVQDVLWELKYGIHGFNVENEGTLVENITQTSYSINGLLANTNYDVYVRVACGGNCEWVRTSFRTDCGIQAIPYIQNFDDFAGRGIPPCWQNIVESNVSGSIYPVVLSAHNEYTEHSYSGIRYLLMMTADDSPQNIIALPQMSDINDLTISFWAKYNVLTNIPESFQIGYMSNEEFIPLESITLTENYRQYFVSLNAVPANADRIAIGMYNSAGDSKVSVEDVEVNYIQSCPRPINVNITSVTTNSAVVTWTPVGEETAWQYTLDNGITWNNFESTPAGTTTMEATITGLTINTDYSLKLRAYCSDSEQSEASYGVPFFTAQCEPEDMCEITYSLFDSYGLGWGNSALKVVDVETGRALKFLTMPTDTFATGTISVCHGKEIRFVWMHTTNNPDFSYTITDVNGYEICHASPQQTVPVSYIVDCTIPDCPRPRDLAVSNVSAHSATISWTPFGSETAWQVCINGEEENLISVTETTYTISELLPESDYTVKVRANCGDSIGVSDWSNSVSFTTLIACPVPTNLTASNIDMSYVTLIWTAGRDETAWQLVLNDDEDNIIDLDVPTYTMTGLSSGTQYNAKVRANCESDGKSEWTDVYEFSTAFCEAEDQCDIIYSLYDSYGDGWEGSFIKVLDAETDVLITTLTVRDGESHVDGRIPVCNGRLVKFVWIDGGGFFTSDISFILTDADSTFIISNIRDTSIVRISCTDCTIPHDLLLNNVGSTWFDLSWTAGADETEWQICRAFDFDNAIDVNSNSYVMTGLRPETHYWVCLRAKCQEDSYSNWLIRPFATLARCYEPTNLIASSIDTTYATLSWSPGGNETSWQICINNDLEHIVDVNDTTYTVTNLIGGLEYTVMVRANCGYEPSEWVETTFITLSSCYAPRELAVSDVSSTSALVTWEGESDSYVIWYRTAETDGVSYFTDFEEGLPVGWTTIDNDEDGYCWQSTDELGGGFNCHSGTVCMTSASFENSDLFPLEPDNWLVSPRLALDGTLKVWLRIQDVSYPDEHFGIFVSTRGNAVADFTAQVLPETVATEEYTEYTVDLSSFNGQMGYIAVRHYNSFDQFRLNLDDFGLYSEPIPAGEWIEATTTENYYEITNLAQGTEYDIQVRSICGDEQSAWSYKSSFATLIPTYTIIATAGENGTITPYGEIIVREGNDQVFMIIPDEGYRIENVLVDGTSLISNLENNTYTFTNVIDNHTIHATFELLVSADMAYAPSVSIFPNPNNGTYNIVFGNISGSVTYQLIDVRGAMIETRNINVTNDETVLFNHNLIPGTYFVRIIATDKVYVEKIIVE
ncbi:MAG: fibronectin type III domain-containing protein [Bacteroidales bacterium]|nr:fibronectin type III domain-containing protein [Bacteroidales bacterium]